MARFGFINFYSPKVGPALEFYLIYDPEVVLRIIQGLGGKRL